MKIFYNDQKVKELEIRLVSQNSERFNTIYAHDNTVDIYHYDGNEEGNIKDYGSWSDLAVDDVVKVVTNNGLLDIGWYEKSNDGFRGNTEDDYHLDFITSIAIPIHNIELIKSDRNSLY